MLEVISTGEYIEFMKPFIENHLDYVIEVSGLLTFSAWDEKTSVRSIPLRLRQLFSKFQVIYPEVDPYLFIYQLLKKFSFLNGNCCEVGAGFYPRLAELVLPTLEQNHHKLTVYDPELVLERLGNAKLVKDKFTSQTSMKDIDTIYGLFPCEATIPMIDKAILENKNLLLAFCGCDHSTPEHLKWVGEWWSEDVCMDYCEKYGKEIQILKWPDEYQIPFPIMVREKQKVK